jgi:signal transduction histidine kinase
MSLASDSRVGQVASGAVQHRVGHTLKGVAVAAARWLPGVLLATRLLLTIAISIVLGNLHGTSSGLREIVNWTQVILVGWNLVGLLILVLPPRMELRLQPLMLVCDAMIGLTVIALFQSVLSLPALLCLIPVGWLLQQRLGTPAAASLALSVIVTLLLRDRFEPWGVILEFSRYRGLVDADTVVIGSIIAVAMAGAFFRAEEIRAWREHLIAIGGNVRDLPFNQLLEHVVEVLPAHTAAIMWREIESDKDGLLVVRRGRQEQPHLDPAVFQAMLFPTWADGEYLFSGTSNKVLLRNRLGALVLQPAADVVGGIADALELRYGCSFPLIAGNVRARIYVEHGHHWSAHVLDECGLIAGAIEDAMERHSVMNAWRDRSLVEARHALSADLHDSVLQTLAALRLRFETILRSQSDDLRSGLRDDLESLVTLVTAEQTHLRQLLDVTRRQHGATQSLSEALGRCADLIIKQWGIQCQVAIHCPDFQLNAATAIEVEFLFREVIANAVQHAGAQNITLAVNLQDDALLLAFRDNHEIGRESSPALDNGAIQSNSVLTRLRKLRAHAYADTLGKSVLLSVRIPLSA